MKTKPTTGSPDETRRDSRAAAGTAPWVLAGLWLLAVPGVAPADPFADGDTRRAVLWELTDSGPRTISPTYREALEDGLGALAGEAGVVLCRGPRASDPAFEGVCRRDSERNRRLRGFRWNAQVELESQDALQVILLTLSLDVQTTKKLQRKHDWPQPYHLITHVELFNPHERGTERHDHLVAAALYDAVTRNGDIGDWFVALAVNPALAAERPAGHYPPPPESRFARIERPSPPEPPPEPEPLPIEAWEREKEAIVNLLLDGEAAEAVHRAERLLSEPDLTPGLAERVEELRSKALEQLARASPPPPPAAPPFDVTFTVRATRPGSGFRSGDRGRLRISERGIRFTPDDRSRDGSWLVTWPSLVRSGKASGVWDVAHPLVIEAEDGRTYYLAELTSTGEYGDGVSILRAIETGSRRF